MRAADPRDRLGRHRPTSRHPRHRNRAAGLPGITGRCRAGRRPLVAPSHPTGNRCPRRSRRRSTAVGGTRQIIPFSNAQFLTGVVPSSNTVSMRSSCPGSPNARGGELDGVRCWRETLRRPPGAAGCAGSGHRRAAAVGSRYMLGSAVRPVRTHAPAAFGHTGLVNIAMWADPERWAAVVSGKPGNREANRYPVLVSHRRNSPGLESRACPPADSMRPGLAELLGRRRLTTDAAHGPRCSMTRRRRRTARENIEDLSTRGRSSRAAGSSSPRS